MIVTDDIPKYRKKSQAKPPKKADHKHLRETCILEIPADWYKKPHERSGKTTPHFYAYCPICGKVLGYNPEYDRYWMYEEHHNGATHYKERVPTEEGARELNPATRTLPTFRVDDIFPKFVDLED